MNVWKLRLSMAGTLAIIIRFIHACFNSGFFLHLGSIVRLNYNRGSRCCNQRRPNGCLLPILSAGCIRLGNSNQVENPELYRTVKFTKQKKRHIHAQTHALHSSNPGTPSLMGHRYQATRVAVTAGS